MRLNKITRVLASLMVLITVFLVGCSNNEKKNENLNIKPDYALIDGNRVPKGITVPCETVIKGDAKSCSIAAASIIAKVTRDRLMLEYAEKYPQYEFEKHKGYGTAAHYKAVDNYGLCPVHRPSFFKKYFEGK